MKILATLSLRGSKPRRHPSLFVVHFSSLYCTFTWHHRTPFVVCFPSKKASIHFLKTMNLPHCSSSHGVLNSKRFSRSCHLNRFAMTATILIIQSPSRIECLLHTTSSCFAKLKGLIIGEHCKSVQNLFRSNLSHSFARFLLP